MKLTSMFLTVLISFVLSNAGIIAYYPFSGNANDFTGNKNNGTIKGAVLTSDRFSNSNQAYLFDGSDYVIVPAPSSIRFDTGTFSISFWVNYSDTSSENQCILGQNLGTGGWAMGIEGKTDQLFWTQRGVKGERCGVVSPGKWHHVVVVRKKDSMSFYIDNILASQKIFSNASYNNYDLHIGANLDGPINNFLKGKIDDIYIYDQVLNAAEIYNLYGLIDSVNPRLLSPPNGSENVSLNPELRWTSKDYTESYKVQVSTSSDFTTILVKDIVGLADTLFKLFGLKEDTRYYWRVCALNTEGTGTWSTVSSFKTTPPAHVLSVSKEFSIEFSSKGLEYVLSRPNYVDIKLCNMKGLSLNLVRECKGSGRHFISVPSVPWGSYVLIFKSGNYVKGHKVVMVK